MSEKTVAAEQVPNRKLDHLILQPMVKTLHELLIEVDLMRKRDVQNRCLLLDKADRINAESAALLRFIRATQFQIANIFDGANTVYAIVDGIPVIQVVQRNNEHEFTYVGAELVDQKVNFEEICAKIESISTMVLDEYGLS